MSEPMRPTDPVSVGGFRLLRRLGAGGMGVVYLGRSEAGALAAVKVIRAESATDDEFRARFAREARAGFTGRRWMSHLLYGSDFPRLAGAAGEGWYAVTPAVDPAALRTEEAGRFTAAWRDRYGSTPEPYATEAYDSARMLLQEFARTVPTAGGRPARPALAQRLAKASYQGVVRTYTFNEYHQYATTTQNMGSETYAHQVRDGRFQQIGPILPKQENQ